MNKDLEAETIDYGDVIFIKIKENIIYSSGFYEPSLYLINCGNPNKINFSNCLFRITPYIPTNDENGQGGNIDNKEKAHTHGPEILETKWDNEVSIRVRKETIEENYGKPVKYGDKIQLLHIQSQEFITLSNEYDKNDPDLLLNRVSKSPSASFFVLESTREKENEPVLCGDCFHMVSNNGKLRFTQGEKINHMDMNTLEKSHHSGKSSDANIEYEKHKISSMPKRVSQLLPANEVYSVGLKPPLPPELNQNFQFDLFSKYESEQSAQTNKILRSGDYIRIKNGKSYLINIEEGANHNLCFHDHATLMYKYNYVSTIFQIVEMTHELPKANIVNTEPIRHNAHQNNPHEEDKDQHKGYVLKHLVSGALIKLQLGGELKDLENFKFKNFVSKLTPIKENMSFKLVFESKRNSARQYFLAKSSKRLKTGSKEKYDTMYLYGSKFPREYIGKLVGLEKFLICLMSGASAGTEDELRSALNNNKEESNQDTDIRSQRVKNNAGVSHSKSIAIPSLKVNSKNIEIKVPTELSGYDPKLCDLTFEFIPRHELYYINQLCSLAEHLNKTLNVLLDDEKLTLITLEKVIQDTIAACDSIFHHPFESDHHHHVDKKTRIQDLKLLKQVFLRELGVFEIIYNIHLCLILKLNHASKLNELLSKNFSNINQIGKDIEEKYEFKQKNQTSGLLNLIMALLTVLSKVIRHSISDNHNRSLSSFLLRILFSLLFNPPQPIYNSSLFNEIKIEIMNTCRRIIWQENPDSISQIEFYAKDILNDLILHNFDPAPLKFIRKVFANRFPSSLNKLRTLFMDSLLKNDKIFQNVAPAITKQNDKIVFIFHQNDPKQQNVTLNAENIKELENEKYLKYTIQWLKTIITIIEKDTNEIAIKISTFYLLDDIVMLLNQNLPTKMKILIMTLILSIYLTNLKNALKYIPLLPSLYFVKSDQKGYMRGNLTVIDEMSEIDNRRYHIPSIYRSELNKFLEDIKFFDFIKKLSDDNSEWVLQYKDFQKHEKLFHQAQLERKNTQITSKRRQELNTIISSHTKPPEIIINSPPLFTSTLINFFNIVERINNYIPAEDLVINAYGLCIEYLFLTSDPGIINYSSTLINEAVLRYRKNFEIMLIQFKAIELLTEANKHDQIKIYENKDKNRSFNIGTMFLAGAGKLIDGTKSLYAKLANDDEKKILILDEFLDDVFKKSFCTKYDKLKVSLVKPDISNTKQDIPITTHLLYSILIDKMKNVPIHELSQIMKNLNYMVNIGHIYLDETMNIISINTEEDLQAMYKMCKSYKEIYELKNKMVLVEDGTIKEINHIIKIFENIYDNLEVIFEIVYDLEAHFGYDQSTKNFQNISSISLINLKLDFWKAFKSRKHKTIPFRIKSDAVNYKYQKMLLITHIAKILVDILKHLTFYLNIEHDTKADDLIHNLIKIINVILYIFAHKNETNQKYLAGNASFAEICTLIQYGFEGKYSDSLVTFFEVTRCNHQRVELSHYILNDMLAQYLEFIRKFLESDRIEEDSPISAVLSGLHFIFDAYKKKDIAEFMPNIISNLLMKLLKKEDFNIRRLLSELPETPSDKRRISFQTSFYSIKSLLHEIRYIVQDDIFETPRFMKIDSEIWKTLLLDDSILLNFELKNEILTTIRKIAFNRNLKSNLINNFNDFIVYISIVYWDIIYFLSYSTENTYYDTATTNDYFSMNPFTSTNNGESSNKPLYLDGLTPSSNNQPMMSKSEIHKEIQKIKNFLITHLKFTKFNKDDDVGERLKNMNNVYEEYLIKNNFDDVMVNINYQNLAYTKIWENYIFDGCIGFLVDQMLFDGDHFIRYFEENLTLKNYEINFSNFTKISIYLIKLLMDFITNNSKIYPKLVKLCDNLQKLLFIDDYDIHKDEINNFCNTLRKKAGYLIIGSPTNANDTNDNTDSHSENIQKQLHDGLKIYAKKAEDEFLKELIIKILNQKDNASYFIQYLNGNPEIYPYFPFVLRVLRRVVESANKTQPNVSIHLWERINETELKDIQRIQNMYSEFGLTKSLFNLLRSCNDSIVFMESCLLLVSYTYGGNRKTQKEFYELCNKDHNNLIMIKLSNYLARNVNNLKISIHYDFAHSEETICENLQKIYEASTLKDGKDVEMVPDAQINIPLDNLKILFATLQALCQGEYQNFQRFLRSQVIMGFTHPKSFNFLEFFKEFCCHVHKILNYKTIEIGIIGFDIIFALTNGDINGNMQDLIKDKGFIEEVSQLLSSLDDKFNRVLRGFSSKLKTTNENYMKLKSRIIALFKNLTENSEQNELHHISKYLNIHGMLDFLECQVTEFVKIQKLHFAKAIMIATKLKKIDIADILRSNQPKGKFTMDELIIAFDMITTYDYFSKVFPNLINIFIILKYIWPEEEEFKESILEVLEISPRMPREKYSFKQQVLTKVLFEILPKIAASVEIIAKGRQKSLIRIWFPKLPLCNSITEENKTKFLGDVDRTNEQTKLIGLMNSVEIMTSQMESEFKSKHNRFGISYLQFYKFLVFITDITALVLVGINIGTLIAKPEPPMVDLENPVPNHHIKAEQSDRVVAALRALCALQIVIASILVFINLWFYRKERVSIQWVEHCRSFREKSGRLSFQTEAKILQGRYESLKADEATEILDLLGPNSTEYKKIKKIQPVYQKVQKYFWFYEILYSFKSQELLWDIIFLVICALSFAHHVVIPFQCLDMAFRSYTVQRIVFALFKNGSQLLWTTILLIIFVLIYSLFTFFDFNGQFIDNAAGQLCSDAYRCFWMVMDYSLRTGGGIGAVMSIAPYDRNTDSTEVLARMFFDLTYFIVVITITLHIVFGMMVDAFSDLREEQNEHEEDQENICFICGLERSEYEKYGNFEDHQEEDHCIWNYIFYIMYLIQKKKYLPDEMTDIEESIYKNYVNKHADWFPYKNSLEYEAAIQMKYDVKDTDEMDGVICEIQNLKNELKELSNIDKTLKKHMIPKKK